MAKKIIVIIIIIFIISMAVFLFYKPTLNSKKNNIYDETNTSSNEDTTETVDSEQENKETSDLFTQEVLEDKASEPVLKIINIPSYLEKNCIGFLTFFPQETSNIALVGAGWTRPHPGPFTWGEIEKTKGNYDFKKADDYVGASQANNVAILATVWPFADWDQKTCHSLSSCRGSGFEGQIPTYRCKPCNMTDYLNFVKKLVERYDGDGVNDMPDLKIPIKYWEILNEPEMKSSELSFFHGTENDYFEILKQSYNAIKEVCSDCQVVHGGNAGSQQEFLSFWDKVFILGGGNYFDIANTHIIGRGDFTTLNVKPFKNLLEKYNIQKPIWVTEVQYENSNADVLGSVSGSLDSGAEKIFFVSFQVGGLSAPIPGQFAQEYKEAVKLCPKE